MNINPYDEFSLEECIALKRTIALKMAANNKSVSHVGTGSTSRGDSATDHQNIRWLAQRIAFLRGEPDPTVGKIGFITMNPSGAY